MSRPTPIIFTKADLESTARRAASRWALRMVREAGEPPRSRCMHDGCKKGPEIEVIWADGRGRAWFCKPHFTSWKNEKSDMPKDIVRERKVPDGVVGEKFGEYPKKKTAKATGTKCGDGESVGLFIPLPKNLAKKFPSLGQEDTSPSHVTFLYIGDFKGSAKQEELVRVLKDVCRRWWPVCKAVLGELQYFDHHDKDRRVPHVSVDFDKDLSSFRHRVKQELTDAGIEVGDRFPEYKPHVTLAYMPGMDAEWKGKVPKGSWSFDKMEVWGLPKVHRLQLGPSIKKISDEWLRRNSHRRVAGRHLVRKIAGWWAITKGNSGINPPPVDKGGLMNAIPGEDPGAARYNGDGPADIMGDALREIDLEYLMAWGRPATKMELEAVFDFCTGPILADGSFDYSGGPEPLNKWFLDMAAWLGKSPDEIMFFQGDTEILDTMARLWREGDGPEHLEPYRKKILEAIALNKNFKGSGETRDLAESLESRLQVIHDAQFAGRSFITGPVPKVVIRAEPGERRP